MARSFNGAPYEGQHLTEEKSLSEMGFELRPPKPDLLELLNNKVQNLRNTNVKIVIGNTIFDCHMMVIQCYSEFFADKTTENIVILPEEKVTTAAFTIIYTWMLTKGSKIGPELILDVLNAAIFLQINAIISQCWACLGDDNQICEKSAFVLYLEAKKYSDDFKIQIQSLMLLRISKFFLTLVAYKEFLELPREELCDILSSNQIAVNSEMEVIMSAVRWLRYDFQNRKSLICDIMRNIRFGLLTSIELIELGRNASSLGVGDIFNNETIQKLVNDGLTFVTAKRFCSGNEKFRLTEPLERQWIVDELWADQNQNYYRKFLTYEDFLQYLEYIRGRGVNHWKELKYNEQGPIEYWS